MGFDRGEIAIHNVGYPPSPNSRGDLHLGVATTGRIQQEPANEGQPQTAKVLAEEELVEAQEDEEERNYLSHSSCYPCRAIDAVGIPPDQGAQHAATIQRIAGNQDECSQHEINEASRNRITA